MEIKLFEDDEFPIWVDLDTGKITCVGFCMQCPQDAGVRGVEKTA